ncbi:translation initiation factor IF-2 N-terminal domain-containing protein, partial [Enterococcus faecalis]
MGKKRIYELAKEMNKASKDVVDKAHQLGMDVKNHMGAISSEQETKLRQAFGGGSTVNTQSKATNNQKQQTTQNKPANKKPMNNKPGEQRNNQNRPNNQSTNGQQRNNNNQNRHGQSNTQNR